MNRDKICTLSGKNLEELTFEGILSGDLKPEDFRISRETLRCQADAAEAGGYQHLALNLRRAAELTDVSNEEVLELYNNLRPGRATHRNLIATADRLEKTLNAPLTAALVREAAEAYQMRGLIRKE